MKRDSLKALIIKWWRQINENYFDIIYNKKNTQNEAIIKQIQIRLIGANFTTRCWSANQHVLWIPKIWKCNSFGCIRYSRRLFGFLSHHCLPLILFNLHLSSWIGWRASTTVSDTHYCHCDLYRYVIFHISK